jgi:hypothetical protein
VRGLCTTAPNLQRTHAFLIRTLLNRLEISQPTIVLMGCGRSPRWVFRGKNLLFS